MSIDNSTEALRPASAARRIPSEDLPAASFFEARDMDLYGRDQRMTAGGDRQRAVSAERYRISLQAEKIASAVLNTVRDLGVDDRVGALAPSLERLDRQLAELGRINNLLYREAAEAAGRNHEHQSRRRDVDAVHTAGAHEGGVTGDAVPA